MATSRTEWRPVRGWPYEVSIGGEVRRVGGSRPLKPMMVGKAPHKRAAVRLCNKGKWEDRYLHHIVLEAFVGPKPESMLGLHRDDNPTNNSAANLYWGCRQDNHDDMVRNHGKHYAKLTDDQAKEVAARRRNGERGSDLAREFNISPQAVCDLSKSRTWAKVLQAAGE